jgi:hypothetical protein
VISQATALTYVVAERLREEDGGKPVPRICGYDLPVCTASYPGRRSHRSRQNHQRMFIERHPIYCTGHVVGLAKEIMGNFVQTGLFYRTERAGIACTKCNNYTKKLNVVAGRNGFHSKVLTVATTTTTTLTKYCRVRCIRKYE